MQIYRVGGAVRDALLGLPVQDIDYVVVGSTPEQMIAAGYTPVGKDFPVFLHPTSKAEYALARTERKSAPGYHGFVFHCAPEVTLEQDLQRRDLTINAMAVPDGDSNAHNITDPYGGRRDLSAKILRHVSDAFAEDPVRILRTARFAARFHEFSVAPETMRLMQTMIASGEVDALVPERVWQELARGLMEDHPSRMLEVLQQSGALARIVPELDQRFDTPLLHSVDFAAQQSQSLTVRWAALCVTLMPDEVGTMAERLKLPIEVRNVALIACREKHSITDCASASAPTLLKILERCDAMRRPQRFIEVLEALRCSTCSEPAAFVPRALLLNALSAAQSIASAEIAKQTAALFPGQPQRIAEQIFAARVAAIEQQSDVK